MKRLVRVVVSLLLCMVGREAISYAQQFNFKEAVSGDYNHLDPEDANVDQSGKVSRGSYLTNAWYDNWTFGLGVGLQTLIASGNDAICITPDFQINITKWVTPTIAFRLGYEGARLNEMRSVDLNLSTKEYARKYSHYRPKNVDGKNMFDQMYFHIDLLFGLSNLINGYKETRFMNVTPYVHSGYYRLSHPDYPYFNPSDGNEMLRDREIAFGPGVLFNFRITNHLAVTCDIRDSFFSSRYHDMKRGGIAQNVSLAFGISYTIYKWYWVRQTTSIAPLKKDYDETANALKAANEERDKLALANKQLSADLDAARLAAEKATKQAAEAADVAADAAARAAVAAIAASKVPAAPADIKYGDDELSRRAAAAELVLFYDINVDKLSTMEGFRLDQYVHEACERDPKHVFYITGSADKGTGNVKINTRLSTGRAENVKKLLMHKYGVDPSQIVIKAAIISDKHEDGRLDRCVLLENK